MGQFGRSLSYLDTLIIALARTGDKRALKPILEKAETLNADLEFSHHRCGCGMRRRRPGGGKAFGGVVKQARHDRPRLRRY